MDGTLSLSTAPGELMTSFSVVGGFNMTGSLVM